MSHTYHKLSNWNAEQTLRDVPTLFPMYDLIDSIWFFETCSHLIGRVKKKKKNTFTFLHQITYYVSKVRILKWKNNRTSRKTCAQSGLKCGCQLIDIVHRWCQCALMCPYVHIWKRERKKKDIGGAQVHANMCVQYCMLWKRVQLVFCQLHHRLSSLHASLLQPV